MPEAPHPTGLDAYRPAEIAKRIETAGVAKTQLPTLSLATLGCLGGVFISLGALFYLVVLAGADAGHGPVRMLAGVAFSLGLILVVVGGAELFTGNALIVMAWVDGLVSLRALLRNWALVFVTNLAGALAMAGLAAMAGLHKAPMGGVAARIAAAKFALPLPELLARGVLCNALVCLAVWLSFAARDVPGKVLAIIFPISAFVALGLEHSIANMFLLPFGLLAGAAGAVSDVVWNLLWVTLGNIVGGAGGVAITYWAAYRPGRT
jgi:formate/nitrite transporter